MTLYLLSLCTLLWIFIAQADPTNLLINGDFNVEGFVFNKYPVVDVISTGINTLVPYWVAIEGGVQMLDTKVYRQPHDVQSSCIMHMNFKAGPGKVVSMPIYTLRDGAQYTVSCYLADNPDGGPIYKTMRMEITDIFGKRLGPKLGPFVVSNHSTVRYNIMWQVVAWNVRGTGKPAFLTVASDTPGSYGPLVAGVAVTIGNLLENGSFENLDSSISKTNATFFVVLKAPSTSIDKWLVETGALKIASALRYQSSTDNSAIMIDLNANDQAATISTGFAIKASTEHMLLFDTAINPEQQVPMQGQIMVVVQGQPSASFLLNKPIDLDSTGFSIDSVGWNTYEFPFTTGKDDIKIKVMFQSKIDGSFGPLLDNVCVFEVIKNLKNPNETVSDVPAGVAASNNNNFVNLQNNEAGLNSYSHLSAFRFLSPVFMVLCFF